MDKPIRALNRDGTDNIDRTKMNKNFGDLYHHLLSVPWRIFFLNAVGIYFIINLIFGVVYFLLGSEGFSGLEHKDGILFFEEAFFFSIQTFSTIGYGRVSPVGFIHNVLVSVEAFTGMLSIAVMSGLLFARFSRPTAKIKFSEVALITQHRGKKCLLFRMANSRLNQIVESQITVTLLSSTITPEGQTMRIQEELPLIRNRSAFFALSWMVAHVIDEKSPLYNKTTDDLLNNSSEIIISLMGYDETFSQTVHARYSYLASDLRFDRQFTDIVSRINGKMKIDLDRISELKEGG